MIGAFMLAVMIGGTDAANAAQSSWSNFQAASARLVSSIDRVGTLDTLPVGLHVSLDDGWKTYWRSPGDAGIAPSVDWSGSVNVAETIIQWPAPHRFTLFGLDTFGYEKEVVFPLFVRPEVQGEPVSLRAKVELLVCSEICVPTTLDVSLDLEAGPAAADPVAANLIERFSSRVPDDGAASGLAVSAVAVDSKSNRLLVDARGDRGFENPDIIVEGPGGWTFGAPEIDKRRAGRIIRASLAVTASGLDADDLIGQPVTVTIVDGLRAAEFSQLVEGAVAMVAPEPSLVVILAFALLGGLILNLMPCVLPVLSIKLLSVLGKAGKKRREVRAGFLASAAGVVTGFWVLAGGLIAAKSAGLAIGWGIQFQQPLFLAAMILIITLFAANLLGFFEIHVPAAVGTALARTGGTGMTGHFAQGAFATLLATPCSAPFLGTAVGFALAQGPSEIMTVFTALGIGLATPYLLIAAFPHLAAKLPKPGAWMIWLRRVLAIALVATAAWLFTVLAAEVSPVKLAIVVGLASSLIVVLWLRSITVAARKVMTTLAVLAGALSLLAVVMPNPLPRSATDEQFLASGRWQPFEPRSIDGMVDQGAVVFVDVTAEWCITCIANKVAVLDRGDVARALASDAVVPMQADWTNPDPVISDFLAEHGRYGIPFNVVYGPRRPEGVILPELLTTDAVLRAIAEVADDQLLVRLGLEDWAERRQAG
jgi:suppressor for copper-sensitivity B